MTGLTSLWSSLSVTSDSIGWQTLEIYPNAPCVLRAGMKYPEQLEGLLIEMPASFIPVKVDYPNSRGFEVWPERLTSGSNGIVRISLVRSESGSRDLFAILAEDISSRVATATNTSCAVATFFTRIKTWQAFMHVHNGHRLSENEEVGLMGELFFLEQVLLDRTDAAVALESWKGPLDGLHDFRLGDHGIEIKSTDSPSKNTVSISSLDQLDEKSLLSLHLVVAKLAPSAAGVTLPELIDRVHEKFKKYSSDPSIRFDENLLRLGYLDAHRERYQRRLALVLFDTYHVERDFPRLTKAAVPCGIPDAIYDVDLTTAHSYRVEKDRMLDIFLGISSGA